MKLTEKNIKKLNNKDSLLNLLMNNDVNLKRTLRYIKYEDRLHALQQELIKLQQWVVDNNQKVIILFEGRDAAGKGGAIRRITEFLNPRQYRVVALPAPDEIEKGQWYFQRYINNFPRAGELVFFDRSWYNRAVVEPVMGFCDQHEYEIFMNQVNDVEKMILDSGIHFIKFYFSITKEEQDKRFKEIINSPLKKWKYSSVDQKAQQLWDAYTKKKEEMFERTNSAHAPWVVINANKKTESRVEAIEHILNTIPYKVKDEEIIKHHEIKDDLDTD